MIKRRVLRSGLLAFMLTAVSSVGAVASFVPPISPEALGAMPATPAAVCGFSCRGGGRYIPGPPSVCFARGLNYCGPSRGYGGPPPWVERRRFYGPPGRTGSGHGMDGRRRDAQCRRPRSSTQPRSVRAINEIVAIRPARDLATNRHCASGLSTRHGIKTPPEKAGGAACFQSISVNGNAPSSPAVHSMI
jgi:hypothetical protein